MTRALLAFGIEKIVQTLIPLGRWGERDRKGTAAIGAERDLEYRKESLKEERQFSLIT